MHPKADSPAEPAQPSEASVSGKWVIIGILTVALAAAGGSWWFRYNATHRAAQFWGPDTTVLIRDATIVKLYYVNDDLNTLSLVRDISKAPGLTHLRNALLEDRSFIWPAQPITQPPRWRWALEFNDPGQPEQFVLALTDDFKQVVHKSNNDIVLNCEPIAAGLREMVGELSATPSSNHAEPPR